MWCRFVGAHDVGSKRNFELTFNLDTLDADMALLEALGIARSHWSPRGIEKRLSYLELCIKHDVIPDAKGQRWKRGAGPAKHLKPGHGRSGYVYAAVPVPEHLQRHMDGLADAIRRCREAIARGDDGDATKQIDSINKLVSEMRGVALDHKIRGEQAQRAKRGRATIADRTARDRKRILEDVSKYERRLGAGSDTQIARKMLHDFRPEKAHDKKEVEKVRGRIRRARAAEK